MEFLIFIFFFNYINFCQNNCLEVNVALLNMFYNLFLNDNAMMIATFTFKLYILILKIT